MEVRRGYKQTEVGVIPEDWEISTLAEYSKKITDGEHLTPRRSSSGYYLLSARNILDGRIDLSDVDYVGAGEFRRIRQRCNPESGDVLISCSGTVGRVTTVPAGLECVMVRSAALVKPDSTRLSGPYAQYFLQSSAGQNQIVASLNQGAQANLFLNHIQSLRIAVPPSKTEQEAIAGALGDADALIESLDQLIAKKRQLQQGTTQELFTGKRRLLRTVNVTGTYRQTEAGTIPAEWNLRPLGDLVKHGPKNGYSGRSGKDGGGTPTLSLSATSSGRLVLSSETIKYLEERIPPDSNLFLEPGDILVQRSNTIDLVGATAIFSGPSKTFIYPDLMMRLRFTKHATAKWFWRYANSPAGRHFFSSVAAGSTGSMPKISGAKLREMPVPVPSLVEQEGVDDVLSGMDAEIAALESELVKARQIKQAMMQNLLTGRIRLV
jgi:type I restriction enzyme S subunit